MLLVSRHASASWERIEHLKLWRMKLTIHNACNSFYRDTMPSMSCLLTSRQPTCILSAYILSVSGEVYIYIWKPTRFGRKSGPQVLISASAWAQPGEHLPSEPSAAVHRVAWSAQFAQLNPSGLDLIWPPNPRSDQLSHQEKDPTSSNGPATMSSGARKK